MKKLFLFLNFLFCDFLPLIFFKIWFTGYFIAFLLYFFFGYNCLRIDGVEFYATLFVFLGSTLTYFFLTGLAIFRFKYQNSPFEIFFSIALFLSIVLFFIYTPMLLIQKFSMGSTSAGSKLILFYINLKGIIDYRFAKEYIIVFIMFFNLFLFSVFLTINLEDKTLSFIFLMLSFFQLISAFYLHIETYAVYCSFQTDLTMPFSFNLIYKFLNILLVDMNRTIIENLVIVALINFYFSIVSTVISLGLYDTEKVYLPAIEFLISYFKSKQTLSSFCNDAAYFICFVFFEGFLIYCICNLF